MIPIQRGGLESEWDELPRTTQESIPLVSKLGGRYLWIDSLYIVQDSNSSWELNAKSMYLVYGNAHFTICPADGDADTGLRAVDGVLRTIEPDRNYGRPVDVMMSTPASAPFQENTPRPRATLSFPTPIGGARDEASLLPLTAECVLGVCLLISGPTEAVIQDSPWDRRGWTFQERLLSGSCLIFAEGHVYFQCRSAGMSQHIFTGGSGANSWSLDWTNSPLRTLGELRRRGFWFYMKCVQLYTGRYMTKPKDVLTAFQGASWLLEEGLKAPLLHGLPSSHFDLALQWILLWNLTAETKKYAISTSGGRCHSGFLQYTGQPGKLYLPTRGGVLWGKGIPQLVLGWMDGREGRVPAFHGGRVPPKCAGIA